MSSSSSSDASVARLCSLAASSRASSAGSTSALRMTSKRAWRCAFFDCGPSLPSDRRWSARRFVLSRYSLCIASSSASRRAV
eukprot:scaffold243680_cov23-Tisochrysis_lutea.AAC.1